jgi:hypothetical protein
MSIDKAQKADAAASKKAVEDQKRSAEEEKQWSKGSKSNAKKYVEPNPKEKKMFLSNELILLFSTGRMPTLRRPKLPARRQNAMLS